MGCAASSDTGTQYASLGHHGNQNIKVSKKPSTPSDAQLYGKNHNERPKSASSSSSSSSSDSDKSEKKKKDDQQNNTNVLPPPVKLTEREMRQQSPPPPAPQVLPPLQEDRRKDPVPPPPVEQEKSDPVPPPLVEQEKKDPVLPPVEQDEKDPAPPPPVVQVNEEPVPPMPQEDNKEDDAGPTPLQKDESSEETDNTSNMQLVTSRRLSTTSNDDKNVDPQPNDESPPSDPVPKDDHPPSDPVPKDDTPPSDPVPTDKTPPSDPVPQDDAPPSDPVPKNDPPPPLPMPTGNNKQNIDYTNTDGVHSPEPPDFTVSDYIPTDIGTFERSINFRTTSEDFYNPQRPTPNEGGLFTDYDFTVQKAVPNAGGLEWLRPGELPGVDNPSLFTDGTTRFDIGQGRFGTCWFLSMVANIADKPRLLRRVIPGRNYKIGTSEYDGVFHCRFWRFGQWSDIYIDDKLPAQHGHLYGASNKEDRNEMWVALLEKAFAKMYGSYEEVTGGRTADAFMNLTAGVGETIKFDKMKKSPSDLFHRLTNAFQSPTTMVGCVCPSKNDGQHGLVGGHAYSMNGTQKYGNTLLVRLRNPWGRQEWSGPWSDGSPEMSQASSAIPHPNKDDGEFYMDIDNFLRYFEQCTICNITPDFDRDGTGDTLNYITTIYGNWRQGKAGGFQNKLQNPAFCVTVNDDGCKGVDGSGKVPFVVQIVQKTSDRQDDKIAIRVDLYKVLHEDSKFIVLDELGDKNNLYLVDFSASYRFSVSPGRYVAIPSTMNGCNENPKVLKEFLIRFFSAGPLTNPQEVQDSTKIIAGKGPELDIKGQTMELPITKCMPGRFAGGFNAGGQISCRDTFASNPQCFLTVNEPQTIKVEIMQPDPDNPNAKMPLGIKLFKADRNNFPADYDFLVSNYSNAVQDTSGNDGPFSYGNSVDCGYCLDPGSYLLIVHSNGPEDQNDFALAIYSEKSFDIETNNFTP